MSTAAQLDLIIRAQDQASRVIKSVGSSVNSLDSSLGKLGLGGVASIGALTGAVTAFAAGGLREFAQAERVMGQTEAALKSTGGAAGVTAEDIGKLSDRFMRLAAVDDEVIQSAENVMLTFTNIKNVGVDKIFDQASLAALNLSARLGTDLQSATILVGKALNDPIKGLTSLSRAGIQFSQDQKDMIRAMVDAGDVMGAQKIILKELEVQFGGSAEAAGKTFAGQLKILQLRFENFEGQVMGSVVPALLVLSGFIDDTSVAVGKLAEKIAEIKEPFEGAFGFISDALDLLPDELKAVAVGAAALSNPITAAAAGFYGLTRVIDHFSGSEDTATQNTNDFATALENAQGRAMMAAGGIERARGAIAAPLAAMGIRDNLIEIQEQAEEATRRADEMRRAIFDALNQPSAERSQRELALAQAQFNVARLDQQGAKDNLLSPDRQSWYNWLVNTFIPAQEDWLNIDSLRVDRDEKGAVLTQMLTGEYRDMNAVIDGQLVPNVRNLNDGIYDSKDALQGLKQVSPVNIKSSFKPPAIPTTKSLNDIIKQADPTETIKVGMEARKRISGIPAVIAAADPTETVKVGMEAKKRITGIPAVIAAADPTETVKVGMEARKTITGVVQTILNTDPTETVKVGMTAIPPKVADLNQIIKKSDPSETYKVGMQAYAMDSSAAVQAVIANIRHWWEVYTNPFGGATPGVGIAATESQAAAVLRPQIIGIPRPDNRGMTPGGIGGGDLHVHFHGQADLSTPTGRSYVVNLLWGELYAKMRTG